MQDTDFLILSRAVRQWYQYYDVDPDEKASFLLNHAAVKLFNQGHRSVEGIATVLIENYDVESPMKMTSPGSTTIQ